MTKRADKKAESWPAELLRALVSALTRRHADIEIEEEQQGPATMMKLSVHADDQSRVVGAGGKHVHALRTIMQYVGARAGTPLKLALLEPRSGQRGPDLPFRPDPDWRPEPAVELLRSLLGRVLVKPFEIEAFSVEDTTTIEIHVDDEERKIMMYEEAGLLPAIQPIFNAIGKVSGRQLFVILPEPMPEALKK